MSKTKQSWSTAVNISRIPVPMQGVCYQPAPTDYIGNQGQGQKYFDTDFYNTDFPGFWSTANGGRGDLANLAAMNVNFLHIYDWNAQRDHSTFLRECANQGLFVAVPFNNSFCTNIFSWGAQGIYNIINEIYTLGGGSVPYSQVAMWTIANEFNQGGGASAPQIAQVAQIILYVESQLGNSVVLPISSPTSFAPALNPGIEPTQELQTAFSQTTSFQVTINQVNVTIPALPTNFFSTRYVAATNPQNAGSIPPATSGITIASWLPTFLAAFPNTPLWFSEIGIGEQNCCNGYSASCQTGPAQQAVFTSNQIQNANPSQYPYLLGSCVFEYTPDYQNSPTTSNNYTFSLLTDNGGTTPSINFTIPQGAPAGGGETYPVQQLLTTKPVYQALVELWGFVVRANQNWQNTGLTITAGTSLTITYKNGLWTADPKTNSGQPYDANGCPSIIATQPGYTMLGSNMGALIGYVGTQPKGDGTDSPVFLVGNGPTAVPTTQTGTLWLCINDDLLGKYGAGLKDNTGSITVSIN